MVGAFAGSDSNFFQGPTELNFFRQWLSILFVDAQPLKIRIALNRKINVFFRKLFAPAVKLPRQLHQVFHELRLNLFELLELADDLINVVFCVGSRKRNP